jgi:hypothetical protein
VSSSADRRNAKGDSGTVTFWMYMVATNYQCIRSVDGITSSELSELRALIGYVMTKKYGNSRYCQHE